MNLVVHFRRYIKLVTQRWLVLLLFTLLGLGSAIALSRMMPDVYLATSKLGFPPRVLPNIQTARYEEAPEFNYFDAQINYMKSRQLLDRVERQLQLPPRSIVKVDARRDAGVFIMSVESTNLVHAQAFAKAWARTFLDYKAELREGTLTNTATLLRKERDKLADELEVISSNLVAFLREHPEVSSGRMPGERTAAQRVLDSLQSEYADKLNQHQRLVNRTSADIANTLQLDRPGLAADKSSSAGSISSHPEPADPLEKFAQDSRYPALKMQLMDKTSELQMLTNVVKPKHPTYIALRREIEGLEQQIAGQLRIIDERRQALIQTLQKDIQYLAGRIKEQQAKVEDSLRIQNEYDRLKEREDAKRATLNQFQSELMRMDITPSGEASIWPLEEGLGFDKPVRPKRLQILLAGLFLGLGLGVAVVYFLQRLDDRLELAEEIEAELDQPVLGQIPDINRREFKDGYLMITRMDQHSIFAEAIRGVRSAFMFGTQGMNKQVIIVSSAVPGDGKTTFTVNFAATLANAGNRVLLVDADLRRGNMFNFFNQPREPGLSEILTGQIHWSDALHSTPIKTLNVIHSGLLPANPGELLLSPVTRQFLDEAKLEFNHVIIDCPPLTAIDDTFSLVPLADGVLFVVRAGQTSMRFARNALSALRQRGAQILGLVLNGITAGNPAYYYARRYHSYYTKELPTATMPKEDSQPASRMASKRTSRFPPTSIQEAARVHAGQPVSPEEIVAEGMHKVEAYKARRGARSDNSG
jgi:capsular exopolysaccharide synthesis family protein